MSEPTEKHRTEAEKLIEARIDAMCMTWDHSFGLMDEARQEDLRRSFRQIAYHDITPFVAGALSNAEHEGMRRAAAIIQEGFDKEVGTSFRADGKPSKNDQCLHGHFIYEDCEACSVAAILSEANTNSPDNLPVEADKATGAVSSPAPVAVPYPWQGRGFNPDSVG